MTMRRALRQMSAEAERSAKGQGEALSEAGSDEALRPRHELEDTGPGLLSAVLARENMQQAWKRVRANKGAAGIDGLEIDETAKRLMWEWPAIREQLLRGAYRPQPVRRVTIPKPDGGQRELGIPTDIANCTGPQFAFGLGGDSTSLSSASRPTPGSTQEAAIGGCRHADCARTQIWKHKHCARVDGLGRSVCL